MKESFKFWNKNNLELVRLKRKALIVQAPLSGSTSTVTLEQNNSKDTGIFNTEPAAEWRLTI